MRKRKGGRSDIDSWVLSVHRGSANVRPFDDADPTQWGRKPSAADERSESAGACPNDSEGIERAQPANGAERNGAPT